MSITSIPINLIMHIGTNFLQNEWIVSTGDEYADWSYPVRNLYATCKSFSWLAKLEYVCLEDLPVSKTAIDYAIVIRDIQGKTMGMSYQGCNELIGYYTRGPPKKGYNHSLWTDSDICYRSSYYDAYFDYDCDRFEKGSCKNCILCTQLDKIQQEIFEKDSDVADLFTYRSIFPEGFIIIRPKTPILDFKFNYEGFKQVDYL